MRYALKRAGVFATRVTILATAFAVVVLLVGFARRSGF
jgi:hypothetical protein